MATRVDSGTSVRTDVAAGTRDAPERAPTIGVVATAGSDADSVFDEIHEGIRLREAGKPEHARVVLSALWSQVDAADDPFARCFLAHSLADVQDDPREELRWDLVALKAGEAVTEERAGERGVPGGCRGLFPSLHLNLAESYLRIGDERQARQHYATGLEFVPYLGPDAYGDSIRDAFLAYAAEHPTHQVPPTTMPEHNDE
jgi:hypothetical protein